MCIPILMYHSISKTLEGKAKSYFQLNTSPEIFKEHMRFLYDNDYSVINLDTVLKYVKQGENIGGKYVAITFDDGYRDSYTEAFPILKEFGFTATIFLPTGFIYKEHSRFRDKVCLAWDEVREMHSEGIAFGSHTVTHPQLRLLSKEEIYYEIRKSKETIEDNIGDQINAFSYPFAFPEEDRRFKVYLKSVLVDCGYKIGVSTRIGTAMKQDGEFFLKRIPVNSNDDIGFFKAKLEGGYDWLHRVQYVSKLIRSRVFI